MYQTRRSKTRNQRRRSLLIQQKLIGIAIITITVLFVWLCSTANEDCAAALLTGPLGLVMLFSKDIMIS